MKATKVGLVADPDAPTEVADRMGKLHPHGKDDADWDIELVSQPLSLIHI